MFIKEWSVFLGILGLVSSICQDSAKSCDKIIFNVPVLVNFIAFPDKIFFGSSSL